MRGSVTLCSRKSSPEGLPVVSFLAIVEQVVGNLERHPKILAEVSERLVVGASAGERAELAGGAHQRGSLRPNERVVLALGEFQRMGDGELTHLAERHLSGRARERLRRFQIAQLHDVCQRRRVEKISHDDGDLMAEHRVHRRHSATQGRMVYGIIVHERREMDQLESGCERYSLVFRLFLHLARQEQQRRTKQLAAHREEVRAHLPDERQIACNDGRHCPRHVFQLVTDWELDRLERCSRRHCDVHALVVFR